MTECRIVVLIPTFNDHDEINQMVIDILKLDLNYEILVVDDGSDRPVNVDSASERVRLIRLPDNLGIGLCVGVAIDYALNIGADFLVRVDGDGQHPVESIPELVAHCRLESADLVLGCRVGSSIDSTDKLARAVMKNWMNFWLRLLFRLKIKDPHTGFCALSHRALTHLKDRDLIQYPELQIILEVDRLGLSICSIPIQDRERTMGKSTISLWRATLLLIRFHALTLDQLSRRLW